MHVLFSKPRTQDNGCGYFMWKDDLSLCLSSSPGPSTPPSSSPGPSTRLSYSSGPSGSTPSLAKGRVLKLLGFNFLSSTMGTIDSMRSVLTQSALDALCEKFHIPDVVHP
ncbi:hypothetical protein Tco_0387429 [Tanacetum coccineum]